MSALGAFLGWFEGQRFGVQLLTTTALFGVLFVFGVLTAGIGPLLVIGLVLVDHWRRG